MEIRTIVSMTDIHEYAKQQLSHLAGIQHTAMKLTYHEKEYNACITGQKMAWEHVLRVEWTNPNEAEVEKGRRFLEVMNITKENDNNE